MAPPTFQYDALHDPANEIRLLRLLEQEDLAINSDHIYCELTTWRLEQTPDYTAVSYTWGAPNQETRISLNGKAFAVRPNCLYLLQQACENGMNGYFWIDAICINQLDDGEKSAQVAMMGDIYRRAGRTNVCIGPHSDDSEYLFQAIKEHIEWATRVVGDAYTSGQLQRGELKLTEQERRSIEANIKQSFQPEADLHRLEMWPRWVGYKLELSKAFINCSATNLKRLWTALDALFERPYFERLWVVQELVLSHMTVVYCGIATVPFVALKEFERNLFLYCEDNKLWSTEHIIYNRHESMEATSDFIMRYKSAPAFDLSELTDQTSNFKCSDLRDRIFGVLSLVDWHGRKPILPDYTKTTLDVALETIGYVCGLPTQDKEQTAAADAFGEINDSWPSWPIVSATQIVMALGLTSEHADIDSLLRARRSIAGHQAAAQADNRFDDQTAKIKVAADYWSRLYLDKNTGDLKSCIRRRDDHHLALNERQLGLLHIRDLARDSTSEISRQNTILSTEDKLCAKLPGSARAGDFLLSFQQNSASDVGLLVREAHDNCGRYSIIGQVIFEDQTELCPGGRPQCVCGLAPEQHMNAEGDMTVWFDPLDLLLFVCQTLVRGYGVANSEYERFDNWNTISDVPLSDRDLRPEDVYEVLGQGTARLRTSVTRPGNGWSSYAERGGQGPVMEA